MAVRRKNSVPGRTDASFHRDSPGDRPRSAAARVGQRHHGAKVRLDLVRERARADWEHTNRVPHAFHEPQRSASGDPSVILVMEPAEDRPGNNVLGRNSSHGRQPTCAERRLHVKTAMGTTMIVTDILFQKALGVNVVQDDHMVEAIAA